MRLPSVTHWAALAVWAAVAACAAFWASRVLVRPPPLPPGMSTVPTAQALHGDVERLLGGAALEAEAPLAVAPSRYKLLGVVAARSPKAANEGVALIAIDDRPARAYRVGAVVDGALVLQKVHARGAELGIADTAQSSVSLSVAPLPPPATGVPTARTAATLPPSFVPPRPVMPRPVPAAPQVSAGDPTGESDTGADEIELPPPSQSMPGHVTQ
ncbi:MAG: hypothetical protein KA387_01905 [Rubrivivax sp.]|jgi:general secretion pathway protein C|nr:hypothetical protein [Rubrivivax sp.]